nr:hypothetical protein [Tanacetum cinerariifolium]
MELDYCMYVYNFSCGQNIDLLDSRHRIHHRYWIRIGFNEYRKQSSQDQAMIQATLSRADDDLTTLTIGTHNDEARSSRSKRSRQHETVKEAMLSHVHHLFMLREGCNRAANTRYNTRLAHLLPRLIYSLCIMYWEVLNIMSCAEEIKNMLEIKVYEAGSQKEIFSSKAWRRVFNISESIYTVLCPEFYLTYEFDEVCADDELRTKKLITKIARKMRVLTDEVWNSLSALTYCRALDTTTLKELINSKDRLIPEDPTPRVPRVVVPRGLRPSMQDSYNRMGCMEIHQGAIESDRRLSTRR